MPKYQVTSVYIYVMSDIEMRSNAMDKASGAAVLVLVLALVFTTSFSMANNNREGSHDVDDEEQSKMTPMWLFHRLRSSYSLYSTLFSPTKYWHLFKATLSQTYTYFFPPNIE